jgi:hypothetical protein
MMRYERGSMEGPRQPPRWRLCRASTVALILVTTPFCVPHDRGATRNSVLLEGGWVRVRDERIMDGCAGDEVPREYRQMHRHVGGTLTVRHEGGGGLNLAAHVSAVWAQLLEAQTNTSEPSLLDSYRFFGLGGEVGYDWRNTGQTLGLIVNVPSEGERFLSLQWELRLGVLSVAWFEMGIQLGRPLDGRANYWGLGFRIGDTLRGHVGAALLNDLFVDVYTGEFGISRPLEAKDAFGAYGHLEWLMLERFGLTLGGSVHGPPRVRLGLVADW